MRIGVDFDNTIADYEGVFHAAAIERGLIDADLPKGKNAVRDFLNSSGRKDDFTALQGYVYGSRMDLARPYQGFQRISSSAARAASMTFSLSATRPSSRCSGRNTICTKPREASCSIGSLLATTRCH